MMSSGAEGTAKEAVETEKEAEVMVCANCGIAQVDDIKLEECGGCQSVSYCSDICQGNHREQHEEECKTRKAELRDKELFEQPDGTNFGECPLCFLPMPLDPGTNLFYFSCCSKKSCMGCVWANNMSNIHDRAKALSCPFCREQEVSGEADKRMMKRVKANDPVALCNMGEKCHKEGNYGSAFEYWTKASELGESHAHYNLGCMYEYEYEEGFEFKKDEEKAVYHYEKAAIGGHPQARNNLAAIEQKKGNMGRAVKHLIIAANLGYEKSMKALWEVFKHGYITKEELDATLRSHKAALNEMKSEQRDFAGFIGAFI